MRSVNVAELKNRLSKYLRFAKSGEEAVIRDRNLPTAKLVPFSAANADDEELRLVAAGKLQLPEEELDIEELFKIPTGRVKINTATQALLADTDISGPERLPVGDGLCRMGNRYLRRTR